MRATTAYGSVELPTLAYEVFRETIALKHKSVHTNVHRYRGHDYLQHFHGTWVGTVRMADSYTLRPDKRLSCVVYSRE